MEHFSYWITQYSRFQSINIVVLINFASRIFSVNSIKEWQEWLIEKIVIVVKAKTHPDFRFYNSMLLENVNLHFETVGAYLV